MQLRRRVKDDVEKSSIKGRKKEIKIKRKKKEIPKETHIKIKKRNPKIVESNKKKFCNRHSATKVIYTRTECPLCDANKLVGSLTDTIDMQRKTIKKGFEVTWNKLESESDKREKREEQQEKKKTFHKLSSVKGRKRK